MASQLAANGYKIAKSWQYQDNLPEPGQNDHQPLNNNTLRPILMANYPPINQMNSAQNNNNNNQIQNQVHRNRSAFAGLKRNRERRQHSPSAAGLVTEHQKLILPKSPMSGQTPDW